MSAPLPTRPPPLVDNTLQQKLATAVYRHFGGALPESQPPSLPPVLKTTPPPDKT